MLLGFPIKKRMSLISVLRSHLSSILPEDPDQEITKGDFVAVKTIRRQAEPSLALPNQSPLYNKWIIRFRNSHNTFIRRTLIKDQSFQDAS